MNNKAIRPTPNIGPYFENCIRKKYHSHSLHGYYIGWLCAVNQSHGEYHHKDCRSRAFMALFHFKLDVVFIVPRKSCIDKLSKCNVSVTHAAQSWPS